MKPNLDDTLVESVKAHAAELRLGNVTADAWDGDDFKAKLREAIRFGQETEAPVKREYPKTHYEAPRLSEDKCTCMSCEELQSMEDCFCIESDYDTDSEEHPVANAFARLQKMATQLSIQLTIARQKEALQAAETLVARPLECPTCRRSFAEVFVPEKLCFSYKVRCRGCELEGRA